MELFKYTGHGLAPSSENSSDTSDDSSLMLFDQIGVKARITVLAKTTGVIHRISGPSWATTAPTVHPVDTACVAVSTVERYRTQRVSFS